MVPLDEFVAAGEKTLVKTVVTGDDGVDSRVGVGRDAGNRIRGGLHLGENVHHVATDDPVIVPLSGFREVCQRSQAEVRRIRRGEHMDLGRISHATFLPL